MSWIDPYLDAFNFLLTSHPYWDLSVQYFLKMKIMSIISSFIYICSILNFRNPVPHSLISVLPCLCIIQKILHPLQLTHHSLNLAPHPFQENCFLEVDHLSFNNSLCHPRLFSLPPLWWICSPDGLDSSLILLLISNVILEYDKGKGH